MTDYIIFPPFFKNLISVATVMEKFPEDFSGPGFLFNNWAKNEMTTAPVSGAVQTCANELVISPDKCFHLWIAIYYK